jgi:hypothetical protein
VGSLYAALALTRTPTPISFTWYPFSHVKQGPASAVFNRDRTRDRLRQLRLGLIGQIRSKPPTQAALRCFFLSFLFFLPPRCLLHCMKATMAQKRHNAKPTTPLRASRLISPQALNLLIAVLLISPLCRQVHTRSEGRWWRVGCQPVCKLRSPWCQMGSRRHTLTLPPQEHSHTHTSHSNFPLCARFVFTIWDRHDTIRSR